MTGETIQFESTSPETAPDAKREQSTILFPYLDQNAGIEVARAMYEARGHGAVEAHELAAQMKQTVSGAFRLKTGTARIFGLTEKDGRDGTRLSDLGKAIIAPETEAAARAEAFMRVPLYAAIYEKYKGQRLPPMKALEREMQSLGVSSKQADKARQAFERSAKQAGYRELGEDRLVRPRATLDGNAGLTREEEAGESHGDDKGKGAGSGGGGGGGGRGSDDLHPFIRGLLDTLPAPGSDWPANERAKWLQTAASIFGLIYKGSGEVEVKAKSQISMNTATDQ